MLLEHPLSKIVEQMKEAQIRFGVELSRRGDKYLIQDYCRHFGITKDDILAHPDAQKYCISI